MSQTVRFEKQDNIAIVTIDRPEALNALNGDVIAELGQGCLLYTSDAADDLDGGRRWGQRGSALFRRIEKLEFPTIAAVNGFALGGGCELALSCDIILASEKAKFGQPEVGLGITPGFSGTQRLPRRVGVAKAKELIFSGKMIKADEAEKIGLVNAVYAPEALMDGALEMAKSFTKNAPIAVKYAKACIDRGMQMDIDDGIAVENELFAMCFATADQKEGMGAFLEKRPAAFQNK